MRFICMDNFPLHVAQWPDYSSLVTQRRATGSLCTTLLQARRASGLQGPLRTVLWSCVCTHNGSPAIRVYPRVLACTFGVLSYLLMAWAAEKRRRIADGQLACHCTVPCICLHYVLSIAGEVAAVSSVGPLAATKEERGHHHLLSLPVVMFSLVLHVYCRKQAEDQVCALSGRDRVPSQSAGAATTRLARRCGLARCPNPRAG